MSVQRFSNLSPLLSRIYLSYLSLFAPSREMLLPLPHNITAEPVLFA
jgi:hypothetical protein